MANSKKPIILKMAKMVKKEPLKVKLAVKKAKKH